MTSNDNAQPDLDAAGEHGEHDVLPEQGKPSQAEGADDQGGHDVQPVQGEPSQAEGDDTGA